MIAMENVLTKATVAAARVKRNIGKSLKLALSYRQVQL